MEKRRPTHLLAEIKAAFDSPKALRLTRTAFRSATMLSMDPTDIVECIQSIQVRYFYKSMTSDRDHRVWQDVYYVPWSGYELYVKFSRDDRGHIILSFKER